mgnify:FL=1|jgi:hypothetical protein|tara:strand:+ start:9188 stop:9565 length:378 start_codon:yes stop_codon:yes gene_type:complete
MGRYTSVKIMNDRDYKKEMYINQKYPLPPLDPNDIYVYANETDRYDILADKFYGDSTLWYIISLANAESNTNMASLYPPVGKRIRIPIDYVQFESVYMQGNRRRVFTQGLNYKNFNTGYARNTYN